MKGKRNILWWTVLDDTKNTRGEYYSRERLSYDDMFGEQGLALPVVLYPMHIGPFWHNRNGYKMIGTYLMKEYDNEAREEVVFSVESGMFEDRIITSKERRYGNGKEGRDFVLSRAIVMDDDDRMFLVFSRESMTESILEGDELFVSFAHHPKNDSESGHYVVEEFKLPVRNLNSYSLKFLCLVSPWENGTGEGLLSQCVEVSFGGSNKPCNYLEWEYLEANIDRLFDHVPMTEYLKECSISQAPYIRFCHAPALIVDLDSMKTFPYLGQTKPLLLDDHQEAVRIDESKMLESSGKKQTQYFMYKKVGSKLNQSLEPFAKKLESSISPFPWRHYRLTLEERGHIVGYCCDMLIEGRKPRSPRSASKPGICLDPVGFDMRPFLDGMEKEGYLEKIFDGAGTDKRLTGYRRTGKLSDIYPFVLFAYLMNAEIAARYSELETSEKKSANERTDEDRRKARQAREWRLRYDIYGWTDESDLSDVSDKMKGSVWRKELKRWEYKDVDPYYVIDETRQMRTKYFARLLSMTEEDIRSMKSFATNSSKFKSDSKLVVELVQKVKDSLRLTGIQ